MSNAARLAFFQPMIFGFFPVKKVALRKSSRIGRSVTRSSSPSRENETIIAGDRHVVHIDIAGDVANIRSCPAAAPTNTR
jgi:hypothetical protein